MKINNVGNGRLTYSLPDTGTALEGQALSGMAPSNVVFTMDPGRSAVARQPGTNLYTGNAGTPLNVNVRSVDAINIPNTIKVFMNYRPSDERGVVYPVPTTTNSTTEGLQDIVLDEPRGKVYISNSGFNRIEVFDTVKQRFTTPIDAGQLPHQMAIGSDGFLYVANTGGESLSQIDLDAQKIVGSVQFPPIPRAGATAPSHVVALAAGLSGLEFMMATSNGTGATASQWQTIGGQAIVRPADSVAVNPSNTAQNTLPGPVQMLATPALENIITMNGTGTVYLFDGLSGQYTASRQLFNAPLTGYYGVLGAAPGGAYYIANGAVLSSTITQNLVDPGLRNVFAVAPIDQNSFVRIPRRSEPPTGRPHATIREPCSRCSTCRREEPRWWARRPRIRTLRYLEPLASTCLQE